MSNNLYALRRIILFASLIFFGALSPAKGQQMLGLSGSNFAGTNSLYVNPAAIADSRHAFYLNLFTADVSLSNNYFRLNAPFSPFKLITGDNEFKEEYIEENINGKPKLLYGSADFRGPSFMMRLNPKNSIAITTRFRGGMQVNNLSENLARLIKIQSGGAADDLLNQISEDNAFNLNANAYAELGFTYARVLLNNDKHFLKAGFTVKRLAGAYSAYFNNRDTKFKLVEEPIVGTNQSDYVLKIDRIDTDYGYMSEDAIKDLTVSDVMNMFTDGNIPGKGWGADIGFSYEYRPNVAKYKFMMDGEEVINEEKNKYKFRIGLSLLDIGGITYDNPAYVRGYNILRDNVELRLTDFEGASTTDDFADVINNALRITPSDKVTSFRSGLPTAFNANLDYNVSGPFYVNTTWVQGLRGKEAIAMRQHSLVAITPRAELKYVEAAFPIALQNNYSIFTVGAMLKVGPVAIGSDNIGGAFNMGDPYGANVYVSVSVLPLLKRNKKDKDKDGVSNKKDKCKNVPGTWALMGCPDSTATPTPEPLLVPLVDTTAVENPVIIPATDSLQVYPADLIGLSNNSPAPAQTSGITPISPAQKPKNSAVPMVK